VGGGAQAQAGELDEAKDLCNFPAAPEQPDSCIGPSARKNRVPQDDKLMRKSKPATNVDEYLANTPEPARSTLKHIRAVIRSVVPKETTEVISYRIPMFKYNGMLVGYAAFKNHCSLFPTGSGVLDQFEQELKGYRTSKGTIQFPSDKPLPDALVKKIVRARVKENKEWE
jgi:uncharacterized protein YdhG (YjbR/CyaY superfamily)